MGWKLLNRINKVMGEPRTLDRFLYNCTPCPCGCNRQYDR